MLAGRWVSAVRMRLRSLVWRDAAERDLDDELRFHVEEVTAEHVANGVPPPEARRLALLSIGGVAQRKDECREARGLGLLKAVGRDCGFAFRLLRRHTAFSIVVILTLAVGIGAAVSVFSVVNALLLRRLPGVPDPEMLVSIRLDRDDLESPSTVSMQDVRLLADGVPSLVGLAGIDDLPLDVSVGFADQGARRVAVAFVTSNYFEVVGAQVNGRSFTTDEEWVPGVPAVAVVSERLARLFGADFAVGQTMVVNGKRTLIAGIAREGFRGTGRLAPTDLWMPLAQRWTALPAGIEPPERIGPRAGLMWRTIGRIQSGASMEVLQAQLASVEQQIAGALPPTSRRFETRHFRVVRDLEFQPPARTGLARLLRIVTAAALLLLILACANVSNALLARSVGRAGDLGTRLALGASRVSLGRALLVEGLVLSIMAGALGLVLSWWVGRALEGASLFAFLPPLEPPPLDWTIVAVSLGLSATAAIGTGLAPMWALRSAGVGPALRFSSRSVISGRRRLTHGLMIVQVAISVVLLVGAVLFVRSINAKLSIDVGLDKMLVQTFRLDPRRERGDVSQAFRLELADRLKAIPGATAATVAFLPPFYSGNEARLAFHADDSPDAEDEMVMLNAVSIGYFDTIGLPIVAGRDFVDAEFSQPADQGPLIVPESVAQRVFGTTDVVGRVAVSSTGARRPIVGVVRDSRQRRLLSDDTTALAFQPYRLDYVTPFVTGLVRTSSPDINIWSDVRRVVADMDPTLVVFEAKSVDEGIRDEFGHEILAMRLALVLGGAAVLLAGVGLASVLARALAERRREFAIRTALGATPAHVAAQIGRQSVAVLIVGVAAGTVATFWLSRYVESRLYGVSPLDPVSFGAAIAVVVGVVVAASVPTCRRAARLDPMAELKEQ